MEEVWVAIGAHEHTAHAISGGIRSTKSDGKGRDDLKNVGQMILERACKPLSVIELRMEIWCQGDTVCKSEFVLEVKKETSSDGSGNEQAYQGAKKTAAAAYVCVVFG